MSLIEECQLPVVEDALDEEADKVKSSLLNIAAEDAEVGVLANGQGNGAVNGVEINGADVKDVQDKMQEAVAADKVH